MKMKDVELYSVYSLVLFFTILFVFNIDKIGGMLVRVTFPGAEQQPPQLQQVQVQGSECGAPCLLADGTIGIYNITGGCAVIKDYVEKMGCCRNEDCPIGRNCDNGFCNYPIEAYYYVSKGPYQAGQEITITISAKDEDGIYRIGYFIDTVETPEDCNKQTTCAKSWTITLTSGTHLIRVYANGYKSDNSADDISQDIQIEVMESMIS